MAVILMVAAVVGAIGTALRQPLIISFIAVGILLGPAGVGLVEEAAQVQLLAQMGIALLLFVVGLKLDLRAIRTMGPVALATGLGQVIFTSFFGFLIALALGMDPVPAAYVALALALSSTIIIIKLLTDKREIDSLHGRITVGILIVQDIVVVAAMIVLAGFGALEESEVSLVRQVGAIGLKSLAFLLGIALLMRYVVPLLMGFLSRSQELLVLFAVAWAVFLALVSEQLGLSKEVGAFLAGVALASTQYRESIAARLVSLRDFLLLFFFIDLGSGLDLSLMGAQLGQAVMFSLFILIGNPLIVMAIMGVMGYRSRTSFRTGVAMAQISEFSLIIAALGFSLGHIDSETLGLITLVGLVTIGTSTYMIIHSAALYDLLSRPLSYLERKRPFRELAEDSGAGVQQPDVLLIGLGRYGGNIARCLRMRGRRVLGVDFDPEALARRREQDIPVVYGDASDPEMLEHLPVRGAQMVVSTIPGVAANRALLELLRQHGFEGQVAVTAHTQGDADALREAGADLVLRPFAEAAEQAADSIAAATHPFRRRLDLPVTLADVRLPPGSALVGKTLREVPLRRETGASVIAVSRAGRAILDPGPDMQLFPGDHIIVVGAPDDLLQAREFLQQQDFPQEQEVEFVIEGITVDDNSEWVGRTLAELDFRNRYRATVIGIERGEDQILTPGPDDRLEAGDRLLVAGHRAAIEELTG